MNETILSFLAAEGVDPAAQQITLMRHKDKRYPLEKYIGTRALNLYQASQPRAMPVGSLLVSVFGNRPGHGVLLGVWQVKQVMAASEAYEQGLTQGSFEPWTPGWSGYFHDLQETELLKGLILKLEIEWPGRELAWRRILSRGASRSTKRTAVLNPKVETLGTQSVRPLYAATVRHELALPFGGLSGASLVMAELRIALKDIAWQQGLSQARGIYLITDERNGHQYIGSASGAQGLLGRWSNYAITGHGGNKLLMDLLEREPGRELDFRFTLLETMLADTPRAEINRRESYWKIALGTRAFGLNAN